MLTVRRIDHLVVTCRNIELTLRFYTEVLGMKEVTFGENRKALAFGRQKLNLHRVGQAPETATMHVAAIAAHPMPGSVDLCLVVNERIEAVMDHLAVCGVPIEEGPVVRTGALGPIRSVYLRDPDGNLIELSNYVDDVD